jgi:hypothetical protein
MIQFGSPHLRDHAVGGKAVVPAAELVAALADEVHAHYAACDVRAMGEARMARFLGADELERCTLTVRFEEVDGTAERIRATLCSQLLAGSISRIREHARVVFGVPSPIPPLPSLAEPECRVDAVRAYAELVPFGPWFHNLRGSLELRPEGATASLTTPAGAVPNDRIGSPFLLDAAMHLACVWGQRYAGFVAIPTGYASRTVVRAIASGPARCVVAARDVGASELRMDLWLLDDEGRVCDATQGLTMAHQRAMPEPPAWILR